MDLTRSSGKCFWLILCKIRYIYLMFTNHSVAIYYGNSKPKDLSQYLKQFIAELNYL